MVVAGATLVVGGDATCLPADVHPTSTRAAIVTTSDREVLWSISPSSQARSRATRTARRAVQPMWDPLPMIPRSSRSAATARTMTGSVPDGTTPQSINNRLTAIALGLVPDSSVTDASCVADTTAALRHRADGVTIVYGRTRTCGAKSSRFSPNRCVERRRRQGVGSQRPRPVAHSCTPPPAAGVLFWARSQPAVTVRPPRPRSAGTG
jgi:hypothetical protein